MLCHMFSAKQNPKALTSLQNGSCTDRQAAQPRARLNSLRNEACTPPWSVDSVRVLPSRQQAAKCHFAVVVFVPANPLMQKQIPRQRIPPPRPRPIHPFGTLIGT